ncbi:MAG: nickel-responsive transcriptional regulator NikR [Verrucomicrobiales bacterium]|nr:nickel-responsive transcriptional regulator NikR [Verrucomicrobiales bacterium]
MEKGVKRISISLPSEVYRELDNLVKARGFTNRSQAVSEMINASLIEHYKQRGTEMMAGTITLFYDESKPNLLQQLASIERDYIDEVISSQHILLEEEHTMEVLLVQGPARRLKMIADKLITCKGVKSGRLVMMSLLLPPIHPFPDKVKK